MSLPVFMVFALLAVVLVWGVWVFNRLVQLRNQVEAAWADVEVQLQRRHDLVPQLVATVKGYAAHENAALKTVTQLRSQAELAEGAYQRGVAEAQLERSLFGVLALQEAYPELKADGSFLQLAEALVEVEDKLQYARRYYNGSVRDLNTKVQEVPDLFVARVFGFFEAEFFQADAASKVAPLVGLS